MAVDTLHPLYQRRLGQWSMIRDFLEGEDVVKARGVAYLPMTSGSTPEDYKKFKDRAPFTNIAARTRDGAHGQIFRRSPVCEVPEVIKNLLQDIDLKGNHIEQFMSDVVYDSIATGFGGLLADLPVGGQLSNLELEEQGIRPYLRYYPAESIINWDYDRFGLTYVVLREEYKANEQDMFSHDTNYQYRVLLRSGKEYHQYLYQKSGKKDKDGNDIYSVKSVPFMYKGKTLDFIPFIMLPSKEPEKPIFYDLVCENRYHYIMGADYANGVHLTTLPTGYVTGHDKHQIDKDGNEIEEEFLLGHDQFLVFEEPEAKVGTLVYSGEGLSHAEKVLEQSLSNMAVLGSRLIVPEKGVSESADSARIHRAGENAVLATYAKNMSICFEDAIKMICKIMDIEESVHIRLCTDFDSISYDPNAINAIANLSRENRLPLPYVFHNLELGEFTPTGATLEEYAALITLEKSGASAVELVEAYRSIREGTMDISKLKELATEKQQEEEIENPEVPVKEDEEAIEM